MIVLIIAAVWLLLALGLPSFVKGKSCKLCMLFMIIGTPILLWLLLRFFPDLKRQDFAVTLLLCAAFIAMFEMEKL